MRAAAGLLLRLFGSLKLAVVLMATLAVVLACATVLERAAGRECTLWYVYHSAWFIALLAVLAANLLASALIRFRWKRRQTGFLLTHAGVLVLLAGAAATFLAGIEGQLSFREGETSDTLVMTDRSQFSVLHQQRHADGGQSPDTFTFQPGPVDWPAGKTLDLGERNSIGLKVLKFYRHARAEEHWVADESGRGGPALKISLLGPEGQAVAEQWLVGDQFSAAQIALHRASADLMREDFLQPPAKDDMDPRGVLSAHFEGQRYCIPVGENLGKKVPLGESGAAVEIAEYLPAAKVGPAGQLTSEGDQPKNPALELRVHLPGKDQPLRQLAFAKLPWLSLDGIHGWDCPVKFWYHHPAAPAAVGVEFLQTPDGELYCRLVSEGRYEPRGSVGKGAQLEIPQQIKIAVLDYLPSARREVSFRPVYCGEFGGGRVAREEAAALVEVTAYGTAQQVWLGRNDAEYGRQRLATPQGPLDVTFGYESLRLQFSLQLLQFKRGVNPGRMGDASFASSVKLIDKARGTEEVREISMNRPLVHDKYTFYQSSYEERPGESKTSMLSVSYDPGRFWKYLGSVILCLGIFTTYYLKARPRCQAPLGNASPRSSASPGCHNTRSAASEP